MRCRFYSTCVKFCLANRDYNSKLILYTSEIKRPFLREPVLLVKSFPEDETQVALLSPLLSLQLLMLYGFSNKCCLQTCITRRNIRKWLFMNELIDSTADGLSVWCIRPRTPSRPMFSQRKVMCAWVCLCEVPLHARGAFTRAKTLLWLQNDKSMQGIFSTNGKNCPHPPPPFPELTLGAAKVRSDAHTTCNHLPQCIEQWFSKRLRSRLFCTQAPTRTDTNTQKIKTQLQRQRGWCLYGHIHIHWGSGGWNRTVRTGAFVIWRLQRRKQKGTTQLRQKQTDAAGGVGRKRQCLSLKVRKSLLHSLSERKMRKCLGENADEDKRDKWRGKNAIHHPVLLKVKSNSLMWFCSFFLLLLLLRETVLLCWSMNHDVFETITSPGCNFVFIREKHTLIAAT